MDSVKSIDCVFSILSDIIAPRIVICKPAYSSEVCRLVASEEVKYRADARSEVCHALPQKLYSAAASRCEASLLVAQGTLRSGDYGTRLHYGAAAHLTAGGCLTNAVRQPQKYSARLLQRVGRWRIIKV